MNESRPARPRMRAPQEAGSALIVPPVSKAEGVVCENRQNLATLNVAFIENVQRLRAIARWEMLAAAYEYMQQYRDLPSSPAAVVGTKPGHMLSEQPIILAGHQPQLFHPGVWFKNFLLSSLAEKTGGTAVNLVVDNDTQRQTSLAVPAGSLHDPQVVAVPYDEPAAEQPYEERAILDQNVWQSFPRRVQAAMGPLMAAAGWDGNDLLLEHLAPDLLAAGTRTNRLGLAFAQARHRFEAQCGLQTCELPLSTLCQQYAFRVFTLGLLRDLPKLQRAYNQALADYRRENRLRSRSHPAPDLEHSADDWEVPLWIWTTTTPRRQRVFAKWHGKQLQLSDRQGLTVTLPYADDAAEGTSLTAWAAAEQAGVKLRPRAFLTTMFARLMLGDVFLHGIGGAKYDEVTDRLITELAGCTPPRYLTATATIPLPLPLPANSAEELRRTRDLQRQLVFQPERFPPDSTANIDDATWQAWLGEKRQLVAETPPRGAGKARQQAIRRLNAKLAAYQSDRRRNIEREALRQAADLARRQLLANREFSFVLHPAKKLSPQLVDLSAIKS